MDDLLFLPDVEVHKLAAQIARDLHIKVRAALLREIPDAWAKGLVVLSTEIIGVKVLNVAANKFRERLS
jgi:hypothetical protein